MTTDRVGTRVTEQTLIDSGAILTREDARILARASSFVRRCYRHADQKDALLTALAESKAELRRAVTRIVNNNGGTV